MLSKEAQHRILEQVSVAYPDEELIKLNKDIILAKREGYIAGAAAEATRAQQLEEVLEKIITWETWGFCADPETTPFKIAKEALNQYRNE